MGCVLSLCNKKEGVDFQPNEMLDGPGGQHTRGVRNDKEDPNAPLLTKKNPTPFDKELDEFVEGLSTDDDMIPNDEEIEAILGEKQD
ncbi:hypothetical protein GPJ56_010598 [Histomonas meleagridis]|uniref:uncharacterized protein n=1 Tax=Histomonas meleagridis TaxID=135588 RepID=UPI00355964D1|nr:hypothetical protein GPJ56_010598 [Histomonas meleagridis]KAH0803993.1 hypothetical protein GO595_002823 [Histomonas meleagridis]